MRFPLASLVLALTLAPTPARAAQPPRRPPADTAAKRDTLTRAEREALRETSREATRAARRNVLGDSATRRRRADSASTTAFSNAEARAILERAREARLRQDSALLGYQARTTQRISVGMGVRRVGLEKLLFRGDNVADIAWRRGIGARVTPVGSRMIVPMVGDADGNIVEAVSIPYYPGRESLWFPGGAFGAVKADIDEREMIHPIANGAEIYYRYATGDSTDLRLADGRVIRLRELRITARKPEWRTFVGSFWFDRDGGQLVRAVYRFAKEIDIWDLVNEEAALEALERPEVERLRDSLARANLPRETYVKDSTLRADRERRRNPEGKRDESDDEVPGWLSASFRPARASLDAVTVEYGLHEGRFWLPRAHSATASGQMGFLRVPVTIDEKFTYTSVNADFAMAPLPPVTPPSRTVDPTTGISQDSTNNVTTSSGSEVTVMASSSRDSVGRRARRDSLTRERNPACKAGDSTYTRVRNREDGVLRVAYEMPCNPSRLETSPELPSVTTSDADLFDIPSREELLAALDMGLQPGWAPTPIRVRSGLDLVRYNRVEGLSVGLIASSDLGAGYSVAATGRLGHADLHLNGDLSLARSNGARTITGTVYHRLNAANPEWAGALSFGPSLPALLYTRDEGQYYRSLGVELGERRERRRGMTELKLFLERQWTAGDSDVVNTFSVGRLFDRRFRPNITAERVDVTGIAGTWQHAFGNDPRGLALTTIARGEAGTGTFEYGRASAEATVSRPIGRVSTALTGALGSSAGRLPVQRLWYMGGLRTVRGQTAATQAGDAFWLARAEVGTRFAVARPVLFFDVGWAGSRDAIGRTQPQRGAGFGASFLDGILRVDISRGLYPSKQWRTDFYLGGPL